MKMSKIVIAIFVAIPAILVLVFAMQNSTKNTVLPLPTVTPTQTTTLEEKGSISGPLSFPSETIPEEMIVCAEKLPDQVSNFCTDEHIPMEGAQGYGVGFKLEVPPGEYLVYALLPSNPQQKAYYSEFVTCGLLASCPSHEPIEVVVEAGGEITDIRPHDWYALPAPTTESL